MKGANDNFTVQPVKNGFIVEPCIPNPACAALATEIMVFESTDKLCAWIKSEYVQTGP